MRNSHLSNSRPLKPSDRPLSAFARHRLQPISRGCFAIVPFRSLSSRKVILGRCTVSCFSARSKDFDVDFEILILDARLDPGSKQVQNTSLRSRPRLTASPTRSRVPCLFVRADQAETCRPSLCMQALDIIARRINMCISKHAQRETPLLETSNVRGYD